MNNRWEYVPFDQLFEWLPKSNIGSRQGKPDGKYRLYIASASEIKYYDEYLSDSESLVFGTGGNPCIHYVNGKFSYTNHTEVATAKNSNILLKFYYYYFQKDRFSQLQSTFVGGGIKNSSKKKIGALLVPAVPFDEQERIVEKIETMLSQLDEAVETLKKTKQQLAVCHQAILEDAFSLFQEKEKVRDLSSLVTSGSRGWAKYYSDSGAVFIRIGNLNHKDIHINLDDVQYVQLPEKAEGTRSKLMPNDVLVSITADLGSIGFVTQHIGEAYINQHIALIRFNHAEQGQFFAWYLRSPYGQKELLKNKRGNGKLGLGLDDIRDTQVPVVSDEVAKSVVSEIGNKISISDSIEKTVDSALQESEVLRQSILKQAFEGEQS